MAAEAAAGIGRVVVKHASGTLSAAALHPDEARDGIEHEAPQALAGREALRPPRLDGPVRLEVQAHRPRMAEHAPLVPGTERVDGCSLRYAAPDLPTAYRVVELIAVLGAV